MDPTILKQALIDAYLDYVNNFITVSVFAEHYALRVTEAREVINTGRKLHIQNVEFQKAIAS